MILIIGGYAQGKTEYVKNKYGVSETQIYDGTLKDQKKKDRIVINHFNTWARKMYNNGIDPLPILQKQILMNPECIIISDEIGNGIVPMEPEERDFREWMGRLQIQMAKDADEVIRVICGLGQKIK